MKNKLEHIFVNENNLIYGTVLAGVFIFANALVSFAGNDNNEKLLTIERIFIFLSLSITVISYKKHEKNVMKATIGCAFAGTILSEITTLFYNGTTINNIIGVIVPFILLTSHLIINSDHHSNPKKIAFNQIFLSLSSIALILLCVYSIIKNGWSLEFAREASIYLFYIACILVLVCIESKLDAYRIKREENGWTDKNGK